MGRREPHFKVAKSSPSGGELWSVVRGFDHKKSETIGTTEDAIFTIPSAKLATNHKYRAWFVAVNDEGESPKGNPIDFSSGTS